MKQEIQSLILRSNSPYFVIVHNDLQNIEPKLGTYRQSADIIGDATPLLPRVQSVCNSPAQLLIAWGNLPVNIATLHRYIAMLLAGEHPV